MALLDVSDVLTDPDFLSAAILIRRRYPVPQLVDNLGRTVFIREPQKIKAVIIDNGDQYLLRESGGSVHVNKITVYYRGELIINKEPDYYSDLIVWKGKEYVVENVMIDALNWGFGWSKAECVQEDLHA